MFLLRRRPRLQLPAADPRRAERRQRRGHRRGHARRRPSPARSAARSAPPSSCRSSSPRRPTNIPAAYQAAASTPVLPAAIQSPQGDSAANAQFISGLQAAAQRQPGSAFNSALNDSSFLEQHRPAPGAAVPRTGFSEAMQTVFFVGTFILAHRVRRLVPPAARRAAVQLGLLRARSSRSGRASSATHRRACEIDALAPVGASLSARPSACSESNVTTSTGTPWIFRCAGSTPRFAVRAAWTRGVCDRSAHSPRSGSGCSPSSSADLTQSRRVDVPGRSRPAAPRRATGSRAATRPGCSPRRASLQH